MELSAFWFGLYKLIKYLVYPYTWLFLLLGILVLMVFWPQPARRLGRIRLVVLTSFAVAYLLGSPLIATQLIGPLEEQYPAFDATTRQHFDAIVVLGGGVYEKGSLRPSHALNEHSLVRTLCGVELFDQGIADRLVMSAGDTTIFGYGPEESVEMKQFAVRLGLAPNAILTESRSRTTYESAVETKRLLGDTSILLVTSASHMPRAIAHFRKQGFTATAAPCGYILTDRSDRFWRDQPFDVLPRADVLLVSTNAISEHVGMWVYRAIGKL
ncbi:MAG: YdcF family protein [Nitrospirota bacterium]|nr:YdcF family protein [Nitrospirota bacterium]